jgi:hypothetical protein
MPETEEQSAGRRCDTGSKQSGVRLAAELSDLSQGAADPVSLGLLTAHGPHQDLAVFSVGGEIDLESAPVLRKFLLAVLEHQTGPVVMDLFEVAFMDSTRIGGSSSRTAGSRSYAARVARYIGFSPWLASWTF